MEALKKDRECVNNRPMFVSKCEPDKQTRASGLRFTTDLEKNKLFVKGKTNYIFIFLIKLLYHLPILSAGYMYNFIILYRSTIHLYKN